MAERVDDAPVLDLGAVAGRDQLPLDPDLVPRRAPTRRDAALLAVIGVGGALGALGREGMTLLMPGGADRFPWAILAVNSSGSALLGLVLALTIERFPRGRLARPLLGTGVLGGYTTFSTYVVQTDQLAAAGHGARAALYALATLFGGLLACLAGLLAARLVIRLEHWLGDER